MDENYSYSGFANVYDALTGDVEYEKRCEYLEQLFRKHMTSKPELVCDLGCGTGTVCSILSKKGYDCIGIDSSDMMLDIALRKPGAEKILYLNQDMCEFELYGTVDVFLSMLDSLNYILSPEDLDQIFALVRNYLNPGGVFIFDVNTFFKYDKVLSDNTFVFEENDVFYTWENSFDGEYCDFRLNFFSKNPDGSYERTIEEHSQRFHTIDEIKKIINKHGLTLEAVYSELSEDEPNEDDQRIFFVVKSEHGPKGI